MIKNWNLLRILRLVLGIVILVQGLQMMQVPFIILGLVFTAMPLFNVGCCSGGACADGNCYVTYKKQEDGAKS